MSQIKLVGLRQKRTEPEVIKKHITEQHDKVQLLKYEQNFTNIYKNKTHLIWSQSTDKALLHLFYLMLNQHFYKVKIEFQSYILGRTKKKNNYRFFDSAKKLKKIAEKKTTPQTSIWSVTYQISQTTKWVTVFFSCLDFANIHCTAVMHVVLISNSFQMSFPAVIPVKTTFWTLFISRCEPCFR